jgi:hypothetical protein
VVVTAVQGIGCSYAVHGSTKVVLQDVWGKAHPGQMQVGGLGPWGSVHTHFKNKTVKDKHH